MEKAIDKNPISKDNLEKKVQWCMESISLARETVDFFEKELDYENAEYVPCVDLEAIAKNLTIMSPEQAKTLYPHIVAAYKTAIEELTNLKNNSEKLLASYK